MGKNQEEGISKNKQLADKLIINKELGGKDEEEEELDLDNPYNILAPPKETDSKKVFVWDHKNQEYGLGSYKKGDSQIEVEELRGVFKALRPYAQKALKKPCFQQSTIWSLYHFLKIKAFFCLKFTNFQFSH